MRMILAAALIVPSIANGQILDRCKPVAIYTDRTYSTVAAQLDAHGNWYVPNWDALVALKHAPIGMFGQCIARELLKRHGSTDPDYPDVTTTDAPDFTCPPDAGPDATLNIKFNDPVAHECANQVP